MLCLANNLHISWFFDRMLKVLHFMDLSITPLSTIASAEEQLHSFLTVDRNTACKIIHHANFFATSRIFDPRSWFLHQFEALDAISNFLPVTQNRRRNGRCQKRGRKLWVNGSSKKQQRRRRQLRKWVGLWIAHMYHTSNDTGGSALPSSWQYVSELRPWDQN